MTAGPDHERYMRLALALAADRVGLTGANPAVGCVLVQGGTIVGEAATAAGGRPHAEEQALDQAGDAARGGLAYVTLEPCGERTGPGASCALRLLQAGIGQVFIACADSSPHASGRGSALLESGGVVVCHGLLEREAATLYSSYVPVQKGFAERGG